MNSAMNWRIIRRALKLVDDIGEFTSAPRPTDPIAGAYHDYTRWACNSYAQVPNWARVASGVAGVGWMGVDEVMRRTCSQYLGEAMPSAVAPFTGGQCPVAYTVRVEGTFASGASNVPSFCNRQGVGPVKGVCFGPVNQFGVRPVGVQFANGCVTSGTGSGLTRPGFEGTMRIVSCTRSDGLPDDCGNPRPSEPVKSPIAPPPPGNPPGGGQEPVGGPFGPIFRPGPIKSPYVEPDIPFPPVDPLDPGGGGGDDPFYGPDNPRPGTPGTPGTPVPTSPDTGPGGGGGDVEGESPEGSELSGLLISILSTPPNAKEFAPGVYRGVAYIYMGNDAGLDQDFAGSMLSDGQFVLAERRGLTKWRVRANTGYKLIVTPYYREVSL